MVKAIVKVYIITTGKLNHNCSWPKKLTALFFIHFGASQGDDFFMGTHIVTQLQEILRRKKLFVHGKRSVTFSYRIVLVHDMLHTLHFRYAFNEL